MWTHPVHKALLLIAALAENVTTDFALFFIIVYLIMLLVDLHYIASNGGTLGKVLKKTVNAYCKHYSDIRLWELMKETKNSFGMTNNLDKTRTTYHQIKVYSVITTLAPSFFALLLCPTSDRLGAVVKH
jgi:hypothetical protein